MANMKDIMEQAIKYSKRTHHESDPKFETAGAFCMHDLEIDLKTNKANLYVQIKTAIKNGGIIQLRNKSKCPLYGPPHYWYRYNKKMEAPPKTDMVKISKVLKDNPPSDLPVAVDRVVDTAIELLEVQKQEVVDRLGTIEHTIAGLKRLRI